MYWEGELGWGILLFLIGQYHFFFLCSLGNSLVLYFLRVVWFCTCVCTCLCSFVFVIIFLILCLPFVYGLSILFLVGFLVCFNPLQCHKKMACGIWVPRPKIKPETLEWECWVQDCRLPENSWPQGVLISENSNLYSRLGITKLPVASSTGQLTQITSKTKIQTPSLADRPHTNTSKHTTSHIPAH